MISRLTFIWQEAGESQIVLGINKMLKYAKRITNKMTLSVFKTQEFLRLSAIANAMIGFDLSRTA